MENTSSIENAALHRSEVLPDLERQFWSFLNITPSENSAAFSPDQLVPLERMYRTVQGLPAADREAVLRDLRTQMLALAPDEQTGRLIDRAVDQLTVEYRAETSDMGHEGSSPSGNCIQDVFEGLLALGGLTDAEFELERSARIGRLVHELVDNYSVREIRDLIRGYRMPSARLHSRLDGMRRSFHARLQHALRQAVFARDDHLTTTNAAGRARDFTDTYHQSVWERAEELDTLNAWRTAASKPLVSDEAVNTTDPLPSLEPAAAEAVAPVLSIEVQEPIRPAAAAKQNRNFWERARDTVKAVAISATEWVRARAAETREQPEQGVRTAYVVLRRGALELTTELKPDETALTEIRFRLTADKIRDQRVVDRQGRLQPDMYFPLKGDHGKLAYQRLVLPTGGRMPEILLPNDGVFRPRQSDSSHGCVPAVAESLQASFGMRDVPVIPEFDPQVTRDHAPGGESLMAGLKELFGADTFIVHQLGAWKHIADELAHGRPVMIDVPDDRDVAGESGSTFHAMSVVGTLRDPVARIDYAVAFDPHARQLNPRFGSGEQPDGFFALVPRSVLEAPERAERGLVIRLGAKSRPAAQTVGAGSRELAQAMGVGD